MAHPLDQLQVEVPTPLPSPYSFSDLPGSLDSSVEVQDVQPAAPSSTYTQSSFLGFPDSKSFSTSNNESQRLSGDGDIIDTSSFFRHRGYSVSHKARRGCHSHRTSHESSYHSSWRGGDVPLLTSLSSPNVGYWRQSNALPLASCSQPVLLGAIEKRQPMAEAFKLASPHYRRPSTFQEKLGKPSSTLPLCERSLMEKAFKEDSHSHSFSFARSPNTPLTPNFQPRHPTNFVSISRKFQGGNSHDNNITGSFLIDPRIRIPAGVLRAFDSDHSLRRRGSRPNALVGSKSTKSDDEKPNLFLSTKNGTIDVDVELVSSPVPLVSESSSKSITVLELNEERSLRPLGHCSAAHGENAGIAVRIGAPHPRPAFHLCINLRIELDSIESPLPSTPSQVSSKSGKKLLQRHRPRQEAEELVSSNNFPAITEDITIQTSSRVAQTEKQSSPIRVLLPQTYHGPVTVTSTTDFTSSSHALHPSATVCLSNSLKETTVLMSETTKTHGNGGQKRKMGYFIHSYSFNEDEDPSPQISQAASSPDHSEDGDDEQWIFVTPSVPTHRGRNAHMPQLQVIGETRSQHKGNPYCEWFGDRVDIRVEFTRPPSANGEAGLSLQNDAVHVIQPEVWLGYSDEEEQFTDQLRHLVDKCATTSCVETQDRHGRVNVEDSRKGVNFLRWLTLGCVS